MKKILLVFLILFILCSCKKEEPEYVTYLNNNDAAIYLYNEIIEENFGINHFTSINHIQPEEITHNYTCIIVNVELNRSFLNKNIVDSFYDLLLTNNNVMIIFFEGENYNFFKNTHFANEKNYYDNVSQICSYRNFSNEIRNSLSDSNLKSYLACLIHLETKIKEYRGSL